MNMLQTPAPAFDRAAIYRICVSGALDPKWSEQLTGMAIRCVPREGVAPMTVLEGKLADQAALVGVLLALHDLHLSMISIECLDVGAGPT
jgi:hypothetical protein